MNHHLPRRNSLTVAVIALLTFVITSAPRPCTGMEVDIIIEARPDRLDLRLDGADSSSPWVLQYSPDLQSWDDLLVFDELVIGGGAPRVSVPWDALSEAGATTGFFRARRLTAEDPMLRSFLDARLVWRQAGIESYEYELQQGFGSISWRGMITVIDGAVSAFETIDLQPPFAEVPVLPTIDELFERVANAIANDVAAIEATWHPELGYPVCCAIDPIAQIADDESRWTIESFTPLP